MWNLAPVGSCLTLTRRPTSLARINSTTRAADTANEQNLAHNAQRNKQVISDHGTPKGKRVGTSPGFSRGLMAAAGGRLGRFRAVLVAPPPGRPSQLVPGVFRRVDDQHGEQRGDLVAGEWDLVTWRRAWRRAGVLGGSGDGEEDEGEHGQGGPPVPGVQAADLVLVQSG